MLWPLKMLLTRFARFKATRVRRQFHTMTKSPREVQRKRLFEQIRREESTAFGRDHGFAEIRTLADFRRRLSIAGYEYFQPYIERVMRGETEAMFHRQRIRMFALTSGTTATRKHIPVTDRFLADYRRGWLIWGVHMFDDHKDLWFKPMVQLVGDWQEERSPSGVPSGSISGLTSQMQFRVVRKTYVLPPESGKLKDVRAKYYLAWRLGLLRDVGSMLSANPSTLVNLARFGDEHRERLIRDIHDGTIDMEYPPPSSILTLERSRLAANPVRAKELEQLVARTGGLRPKDVWPNLGMLGNWTGGSVGGYLKHYPEHFGAKPSVRDIGLIASEGRMTIPIRDGDPGGILDVSSSFFEFVPIEEMDSANPIVLESHELIEGRDYYILLTTTSGLYRYNIFDVVRCVGWQESTPILTFLNKGSNISNLTGEKLSEFQIVKAVEQAAGKQSLQLTAYAAAPCWDEETPYYGLFVEESDFSDPDQAERLAAAVESLLQAYNTEYSSKRESHRLKPLRLQLLPRGAWQRWDRERLARTGGAAEQYKHPCLIPDTEFQGRMPVLQPCKSVSC